MEDPNKQTVEEGAGAGAVAAPTQIELDLAAANAKIASLSTERDNYKKGMLKAKGKLKEDGTPEIEETLDEKVERLLNEKMLDTDLFKANQDKDEIIKRALERNKELETAIKNRSQISTTGAGAGSETKFTIKDTVLSEEKLASLKAMGWDDKKIERYKKNLLKVN